MSKNILKTNGTHNSFFSSIPTTIDDMKSKSTYVDYRLWKTHMIIHFEEHSIFSTLLAFKDAF